MLTITLAALVILAASFLLSNFRFLSMIIIMEIFNVLVLLNVYFINSEAVRMSFLIFMVVATMEVTVSLVCLTRLWDFDSFLY
uniref:NADH dehydrogenase subunit 4L n=1 Tax=Tetrancistrum nebulosi TaxID=879209 RepID=I3NLS1_9PLAT|nr:NADH dehydrogenase subunit 4L [Tetrancistrum nebulosi]ADN44064.1 NADH dehydrogenase subunit 4L [Tetrancistrum nebulosi]